MIRGYSGVLTPRDAAIGINLALRNARRLAVDAGVMLDVQSLPSAASLAALSIEEVGKVPVLRAVVLVEDEVAVREEWKRYRRHRAKNGLWIMPSRYGDGVMPTLDDMKDVMDQNADHTQILDTIKQLGFYTDLYEGDGVWHDPEETINETLARGLVDVANRLSRMREVTEREMELWCDCLRPHWKKPSMKQALLEWHKRMVVEGLARETHENFSAFVTKGQASRLP